MPSEHFSAEEIAKRFDVEKGVVQQIALWMKTEWKEEPDMNDTLMVEHVIFDYYEGRSEDDSNTEEMVSEIAFAIVEGKI